MDRQRKRTNSLTRRNSSRTIRRNSSGATRRNSSRTIRRNSSGATRRNSSRTVRRNSIGAMIRTRRNSPRTNSQTRQNLTGAIRQNSQRASHTLRPQASEYRPPPLPFFPDYEVNKVNIENAKYNRMVEKIKTLSSGNKIFDHSPVCFLLTNKSETVVLITMNVGATYPIYFKDLYRINELEMPEIEKLFEDFKTLSSNHSQEILKYIKDTIKILKDNQFKFVICLQEVDKHLSTEIEEYGTSNNYNSHFESEINNSYSYGQKNSNIKYSLGVISDLELTEKKELQTYKPGMEPSLLFTPGHRSTVSIGDTSIPHDVDVPSNTREIVITFNVGSTPLTISNVHLKWIQLINKERPDKNYSKYNIDTEYLLSYLKKIQNNKIDIAIGDFNLSSTFWNVIKLPTYTATDDSNPLNTNQLTNSYYNNYSNIIPELKSRKIGVSVKKGLEKKKDDGYIISNNNHWKIYNEQSLILPHLLANEEELKEKYTLRHGVNTSAIEGSNLKASATVWSPNQQLTSGV